MTPGSLASQIKTVERRDALRIGYLALDASWPRVQVPAKVWIGRTLARVQAAFKLPGVVRVTLADTGELLVQSKPGQPLEVDTCAT